MAKSSKVNKNPAEQPTRRSVTSPVEAADLPPAEGSKYQVQCTACKGMRYRFNQSFVDPLLSHRSFCSVCRGSGLLPYDWEAHAKDLILMVDAARDGLEHIRVSGDKLSANLAGLTLIRMEKIRS